MGNVFNSIVFLMSLFRTSKGVSIFIIMFYSKGDARVIFIFNFLVFVRDLISSFLVNNV